MSKILAANLNFVAVFQLHRININCGDTDEAAWCLTPLTPLQTSAQELVYRKELHMFLWQTAFNLQGCWG